MTTVAELPQIVFFDHGRMRTLHPKSVGAGWVRAGWSWKCLRAETKGRA